MVGVICMDGKHKTRKVIHKTLLGLLELWREKKESNRKVIT